MKLKEAFEPFFIWQKKVGMAPKTIKNDQYYLYGAVAQSVGDIELADLKKTDVAKVIEAGRNHGQYGPLRGVCMLRKLLKYLKESGHEIPFRWQDIRLPSVAHRQVEYLTEQELEKLLDSINLENPAGLRTRALFEVLYATGMRIGEAVNLNRQDIDWDKKEVLITNVKSKAQEKVYLTDRSAYWLKRYIESRYDREAALFVAKGRRLSRETSRKHLRYHLAVAAAAAGIQKRITHHLFRKTFVTHLLQHKADIMAVKDLARHRSERTTLQNYAGVNKERSKAIHAGIMNNLLA